MSGSTKTSATKKSSTKTKVLVVGAGGREHALAWRLSRGDAFASMHDREVVVSPGNPGIARAFRCVPHAGTAELVALCQQEQPALVVIGPEQPLVDGAVDALTAAGFTVFGPTQGAARLEGDKAFMKDVVHAAGVRTAAYVATSDAGAAAAFIAERAGQGRGVVVKAAGLCAGKGVVVCTAAEVQAGAALRVVHDFLGTNGAPRFGAASRVVVLEDLLLGDELSVFALCDGERALMFGAARDHKRLLDGDRGPNTGGMGAVAPLSAAEGVSAAFIEELRTTVFAPVLKEMAARGVPFRGVLFAGLMVHEGVATVLEFNARFGDPETEALMVALASDLFPVLLALAQGTPVDAGAAPRFDRRATVVVMAAAGYPDAPQAGAEIQGIEGAEALPGARVFCAGVGSPPDAPPGGQAGVLVAKGGRVLVVAGAAPDFALARKRAYAAVSAVTFEGAVHRKDIGKSVVP